MADDIIGPPLPEIISRAEAKAKGLKRYFNGRPCKSGHMSERLISSGNCVRCAERNAAAYKKRNRKKVHARIARWQAENAEWVKARRAAHRAANPGKFQAARAAWIAANPGRLAELARSRYRADPHKALAPNRNRRAKKKNAGGRYTPADIQRIYDAQRGKCACCKSNVGKKYEVDHIQPISKGGSNWPRNLQILCGPCNRKKHAHDPIDYMQSLGLLL